MRQGFLTPVWLSESRVGGGWSETGFLCVSAGCNEYSRKNPVSLVFVRPGVIKIYCDREQDLRAIF
ncbi:hypothetical protein [Microcoleus sp. herbarium12]|uniref:hypothetical protein n=1 Tax=Microcoleus sp. herbarium12 TaxID=3055437 RepID=UPI002FD62ACB